MKFSRLHIALLMVLALFAFGCNGKRVAIVNMDTVYKDSIANEKGSEYLKNITSSMQTAYEAAQAKVEAAKDKDAKTAAEAEMQQTIMEIQQRFNAEQQQVAAIISEAFSKAVDNCRAKGKYDLIIPVEAALSYDKGIDVTANVLEELNAIPIEFTPITPETPVEQPEQAAEQPKE